MNILLKSRLPDAPNGRIRRLGMACGLAALVSALLVWFPHGPLERARLGMADWLIEIGPKPKPPLKFALVVIDSSCLTLDHVPPEELEESLPLRQMAAGYPWSREVYADAIRRMLEAGAKLVILDVLLLSEREGDEALRGVISDFPNRVVLVSNFAQDVTADGIIINRYQEPSPSVVPEQGALIGFANFWKDSDGVVRSAPFTLGNQSLIAHSSPAVAIRALGGEEMFQRLPASSPFRPCMKGLAPDLRVPLWQIFSTANWKTNLQEGEVFRDRVIAIGASATQFHDEFRTPVGNFLGAGLHLSVIGAAWEHAFFTYASHHAGAVAALFGGLAALLIWLVVPGLLGRLGVLAVLAGAMVAGSVGSTVAIQWMPPLFAMAFGLGISAVAALGSDLITEGQARRQARRILERYVSPGVAREILDHRAEFLQSLGGARREVTVLFSDVRGFTTASEGGEPTEIFDQLNEYLGSMVDEVLASGGGVDKFLGDGILAVWGTLARRPASEEAAAALACAERMLLALEKFNEGREIKGLTPWKIGIGVHSGPVLFGNIGSESRMEPTVIGDTVNLASRIEGITKPVGCQLLVSSATASLAGAIDRLRPAERVRVVGRAKAVDLFTTWPAAFSAADRSAFTSAVESFRGGRLADAREQIEVVLTSHPDDPICRLYSDRILKWEKKELPAGWDGTAVASSK
ncbi:MAG: adenylate/guanylate cyclase domain-containing protein [Terrimicrobiaceae bacterium]